MAKNASSNEDPSIEEILDSIRQIISEDDSEPEEPPKTAVQPAPEPEPEKDDNFSAPAIQIPEPEPEPEDDVFELTEKVDESLEVDFAEPPKPKPEPKFESPVRVTEEDPDSILTESAENAAYDAMTALVRKTAVENIGKITLEDIVRSELKPLLRAWLDKNLPIIIERLVREELERVSKRALEE